jgi:hypothetical protein
LSVSHSLPLLAHPLPFYRLNASFSQDLDTSDYLNDSPTLIQNSKTIFDNALVDKSAATDDFLVIAHDIHNQTSEVLVEYMLQGMAQRGFRGVTVGECLGDAKENRYRVDGGSTLGSEGS